MTGRAWSNGLAATPLAPRQGGTRMRKAAAIAALLLGGTLGAAGSAACSPGDRSADALEQARREVDQRLSGRWRLVSFTPETPLNPALQTLLAFQSGRLIAVFEAGRVRAEAPGITFDNAYRIQQPEGDKFQIVIIDPQGVSYVSGCQFDDKGRLLFRSWSEPWIGSGVLERQGG